MTYIAKGTIACIIVKPNSSTRTWEGWTIYTEKTTRDGETILLILYLRAHSMWLCVIVSRSHSELSFSGSSGKLLVASSTPPDGGPCFLRLC
ncbi:major facilitator superfamily transporter [Colletotrichum scovillei]|uniref:Major facilitator superfamily transporter n=1 Tax=Colletotrichum scovillei TaxID=1209932 RepID=A0A9P7RLA1_9PEZI|nr:major facilitator superfamily transporter [Colletotrichum scovillei]KAG7077555.1 major facilitator superfamily transporter [Colletotrichum scovillei]KAG7084797.1 major facilitator superfamily transporter [Colletotrichum scovillei]